MARKVVDLTIRLKDGVTGKLSKMRSGLTSLGAGLKKVAIAGVAMAAAIGVAVGKMAKTFAAQQDAEVALASALDQVGLSGKALLPIFQEYATSIQRVTKYGDEAILASMAYGKNLGINTAQLKEATTAALGLASKYKIDLQTAMMLVGRASQGQTQMLTRYGIVLEETLTPQEKFNEVLKIGAEAFSLAKAETQSASGAWQQFTNALGDAQETIIAAMTDGEDLIGVLNNMTEAVARLIDEGDLSFWASETKANFEAIIPIIEKIDFLIQSVFAGARSVGGFIGGVLGERERQKEQGGKMALIDPRNIAKAYKMGFAEAKVAHEDYLARREGFKKAFKEERADKLKLAEEVAKKELAAKTEVAKEVQAEQEKSVKKVAEVMGEAVTEEFDDSADSFQDRITGIFDEMEDPEPLEFGDVSFGPSAPTPSATPSVSGGGGGISGLGGAADLFGALTTGLGRSTRGDALEQIKELLHGNPEEVAEAMKVALTDVYADAWEVKSDSLTELIERTNDTLAEMYALQNERLGGVLN